LKDALYVVGNIVVRSRAGEMHDQVISSFVIKVIPFLRGGTQKGTRVFNLSHVAPFICNSKSSTHILPFLN
jgi:hypothetical protein